MEKIAIIEIDSRELKLTLAKLMEGGFYYVYDEIKDVVKLGEDLEKDEFLKTNRINETINILKGYKKLCEAAGIEKIDTVILNDLTLAKNLKSFVGEILTAVGLKVKVLDTEEQQKAIYAGVINTIEVPKGIIIKIGFQSTTIIKYIRRAIVSKSKLDFGVCTLAEKFKESKNFMNDVFNYVLKEVQKVEELCDAEVEFQLVGVGTVLSSISKISRMARKYSFDKNHGYVMQSKEIKDLFEFFKTLDLSSTQKIRGISEDRADFIAAGVAVLGAIFDKAGLENYVACDFELTQGLILLNGENQGTDKPITDILGYSLETQRKFFEDSMSNSINVYNLSMILYKQLRVLHKLPRPFVKVLRIASYFYDSGKRINFYGNTKNSFYPVLNFNVCGASHKEQILAAFVCSTQDAVDFNLAEFVKYRDILTQEDLDAVKKLGVIVRLAKGLDRCGKGIVKDITCDILGDSVILKVIADEDASFEIRDALKASSDFKKAFKKNLEIL